MRLRWLVAIVFAVAVLPLALLDLITYQREFEARRQMALSASTEAAKLGAAAVEAFFSATIRTSAAAGQIIASQRHSPSEAALYLRQAKADNPEFSSIAMLDPQGKVIADVPAGSETYSDKSVLKRLADGKPWHIGNLEQFRDGSLRFHILVGIRRDGKLVSVIDTTVKDSAVYSLVKVRIGKEGNVGVIDASGHAVILTFAPDLAWNKRYRGWIPSIRKALKGKSATIASFHDPLDNIDRMGASVPVPGTGWVVNVFRPVGEVLGPINAEARSLALQTIVLSTASLVAILLLAQLVGNPLAELARATARYRSGELDFRVRDSYRVLEIRELAQAFNKTAAALQEELEREHHIADTLQRGLLPAEVPDIEGYSIGTHYSSATKEALVGGDFFEFIELGSSLIGLAIGDVQGHGVDAAITAAMAKMFLRDLAGPQRSPAWVMQHLNEALCRQLKEPEQLVTMVYAVLNFDTGFLSFCSAGHPPPLICGKQGVCRTLAAHQDVLGLAADSTYANADEVLGTGELLCLYTDGVTESRADGEMFGVKGLRAVLSGAGDGPAAAKMVYEACFKYSEGDLRDDLAVVAVRRLG